MQVRIAFTPPRLPRWKRKPAITTLGLQGVAEIANNIEKYGSGYIMFLGGMPMAFKYSTDCPRNSVTLVNMGLPR